MCCSTCMWFVEKSARTLGGIEAQVAKANMDVQIKDQIGRCRRHAPTMNGYPAVFTSDWCGDHKLDENKV